MARRCWDDIQKTINKTKDIHVFHDMHPGTQLSKIDIDKASGAWVTSIQDYTLNIGKIYQDLQNEPFSYLGSFCLTENNLLL